MIDSSSAMKSFPKHRSMKLRGNWVKTPTAEQLITRSALQRGVNWMIYYLWVFNGHLNTTPVGHYGFRALCQTATHGLSRWFIILENSNKEIKLVVFDFRAWPPLNCPIFFRILNIDMTILQTLLETPWNYLTLFLEGLTQKKGVNN